MNTQPELQAAEIIRYEARHAVWLYCEKQDRAAATLALLATALEQECLAQGINPDRLKFFTKEVLE